MHSFDRIYDQILKDLLQLASISEHLREFVVRLHRDRYAMSSQFDFSVCKRLPHEADGFAAVENAADLRECQGAQG